MAENRKPDETQALAPISNENALAFDPRNMHEAWEMAEWLCKSNLIPSAYRGNPSNVLVAIMFGREMGIGPMMALLNVDVIEGKPALNAHMTVAKVKARPDVCKFFRIAESTAAKCRVETHRVGSPEPESFEYTMDDARTAGLTGKNNWKAHPKQMLFRRASSHLARAVYGDVIGNVFDPDEIEDIRMEQGPGGVYTMAPPKPAPARTSTILDPTAPQGVPATHVRTQAAAATVVQTSNADPPHVDAEMVDEAKPAPAADQVDDAGPPSLEELENLLDNATTLAEVTKLMPAVKLFVDKDQNHPIRARYNTAKSRVSKAGGGS